MQSNEKRWRGRRGPSRPHAPPVVLCHTNSDAAAAAGAERFIASVSSSSHDRFIANPFSVRRINHGARCRGRARLCSSVDYKRGALEIPLNSEEVLIMHSALIPFPHVACRVTCDARRGPMRRQMIKTVGTESENTTACTQRGGFPCERVKF